MEGGESQVKTGDRAQLGGCCYGLEGMTDTVLTLKAYVKAFSTGSFRDSVFFLFNVLHPLRRFVYLQG